jgi:endo-1,4-beta-xylanase
MMGVRLFLLFSLAAILMGAGTKMRSFTDLPDTPTPSSPAPSTLRAAAAANPKRPNFLIGAAVAYPPLMAGQAYRETLAREFNTLVAENVMKWESIHPDVEKFNFEAADALVKFAETNQMQVRGHTLVWHQQLGGWLTAKEYTREELLAVLKTHIQTVVSHYKGKIFAWDVVNEAVNDNGTMRESLWYKVIGADYIEQAFRFAHEADPDALLFYNDYSAETLGTKSDAVYNMVKALKAKGVPIDGVGLQMHIGIAVNERPNPQKLKANIERLAALGLQVHITEMDVKIQNGAGTREENLARQGEVYAEVLGVCLQEPACTALLAWGFTDRYTWIPGFTHRPDEPLLFDKDYQPKPAYRTLLQTLAGK